MTFSEIDDLVTIGMVNDITGLVTGVHSGPMSGGSMAADEQISCIWATNLIVLSYYMTCPTLRHGVNQRGSLAGTFCVHNIVTQLARGAWLSNSHLH